MARVDLAVADLEALRARARESLAEADDLTDEELDVATSTPFAAIQSLLPDVAGAIEDVFGNTTDTAWIYVGATPGEFDRDEPFEDVVEDDDHRAFAIELYDGDDEDVFFFDDDEEEEEAKPEA